MAPHSIATTSTYSPSSSTGDMTSSSSVDSDFTHTRHGSPHPLTAGVYVPTPCFFHPNEDVDTETIAAHSVRLARAGVAGLTTQGSNGEAVHLTYSERALVTRTTRAALDNAGFPDLPVIVGCGAQSTRETIAYCEQAAEAGGDYVLILPPSYYKGAMSRTALMDYYSTAADASPLPVMVYNYPGAASGTDLDSDFLEELAGHTNVVGVKLTCGNVGKLGRIASATGALTPSSKLSKNSANPFLVLAGSADFFLPALSVNGSGTLAGLANIVPRAHVALLEAYRAGDLPKAQHLQDILGRADLTVQRGGVVGTKEALKAEFGYGGFARRPLPRWNKTQIQENKAAFEEVLTLERSL
ncbi:MAG: hypothetical protein MMC23_007383 [Stictis urceolatum]|nr:hypothetical protein [Stictis urceolata]